MSVDLRRSRVTRYKAQGFTLMELVIVIAIMAILAAIAAPNYTSFMAQRRLNGAARQIMSDLMHARMQAVNQNNEFKITFVNSHEYQILDDDNGNGSSDSGESVRTKSVQTDYSDVTLSSTANPVFNPRGTANGATITLSNSAGSKIVSLAITGRVIIGA